MTRPAARSDRNMRLVLMSAAGATVVVVGVLIAMGTPAWWLVLGVAVFGIKISYELVQRRRDIRYGVGPSRPSRE